MVEPSLLVAFVMLNVASIEVTTIHSEACAMNLPGQIRLPTVKWQVDLTPSDGV